MKLTTLLAFSFTLVSAAEPSFEWINSGGGTKNDKTRSVCLDRDGNVFMAGETTDDGTFGDIQRKGLGGMDFCLVKVDPAGHTLWVRSIGGSLVDRGYGVATDAKGNAYVTGHFQSTDAVAGGTKLPNAGDYDIFVAKYDRDGNLLWIRTAGGAGYDYGHGIAVDGKGDVVVAGAVGSGAMFGDKTLTGSRTIFCAKYDADGKLIWVRGTEGKGGGSAHGVALDAADNIYLGGSISGEGTLGTRMFSTKTQAAFVARLRPDGEADWIITQPGMPSAGAHEISADAGGRVWIAGMFKGSVAFGSETFRSMGDKDNDGFIAHYNAKGELQWARHLHGPATDYCLGIANDGHGTCFVTGEFTDTSTFAAATLKSQGSTDIFTAALDDAGKLDWITITGGVKGDNAYTMAYQPDGHLIIAGACIAPAAFGSVKLEQGGGADLYSAKIRVK